MTPETLPRHELAGLRVEVVDATDPGLVGLAGRVVDETTNTLLVAPADAETGDAAAGPRVKQVPKAVATFAFELPDAPADEESAWVTVAGERLLARPARRTETRGEPTWR